MKYIEKEHLPYLFKVVYRYFSNKEDVPVYEEEIEGIGDLLGVFEGAKQSFYPSIKEKAAYYLLQLNKGHYFSNGNKRIALVCINAFLLFNEYRYRKENRDFYKKTLTGIFPQYTLFEDDPSFTPEGFGLYNLSILIADSQKYVQNYDELKEKVTAFIEQSIEPLR